MKIQSVSNYASNSSFSSVRNVMNNTTPFRGGGLEASTSSINLLMDKNYNSAFIKPQSLSFKGLGSLPDIEGTNPIEDKISTVLGFSETDDVVVVGKDIETVKKDLAENIDTIPKVINRILFIPDESAETSFMVANNLFNVPYLQNLGENPIYHESENNAHILKQGHSIFMREDSKFRLEKDSIPFSVKPNMDATLEDFDETGVQIFDFSKLNEGRIKALNQQRIIELNKAEEKEQKGFTFKDVGGQRKAIQELKEAIVYPIKYPEAFKVMNHGIILEGGPGTGKSLLAEALANEVDASFIKLNGLEMESKWVGESEENMRKLFEQAKSKQPCIVFIDEFDAIARKREGSDTSRHDDKMVNQMLSLMSDLEKQGDKVFVVAATNRKDVMDEAILRSGRFGKHISVPNPDLEGCEQIFDIHTKKKAIDEDFDKKEFIKKLHKNNLSGADIAAIIESAQNKAYHREGIFEKMENETFSMEDLYNLKINEDDFNDALDEFKEANKKDEEKPKNPIGFIWNN